MIKTWTVATSNSGKYKEFVNFLGAHLNLISMEKKNIQGADEPHNTFIENALHKARHVSKITKSAVLADDSGLVVEALNGSPGVMSARFFQGKTNLNRDKANNDKLLKCMSLFHDSKERSAYFVSVLVGLSSHIDPCPAIAIGIWHGQILFECLGNNGHGYDPVFFCPVANKSAAQMSLNEKEKYSHRGIALNQILPQLIRKNSQ